MKLYHVQKLLYQLNRDSECRRRLAEGQGGFEIRTFIAIAGAAEGRRPRGPAAVWPWWAALFPLAAALRGIAQPVTKLALVDWPSPVAAALIGYSVSSLVVTGVSIARGGWPRRPSAAGALWFGMVGFCNVAAVLLLYAALARGPVTLVSPLVATYPLLTLALSALLLRTEPLDARVVGGVTLTVAGVVVLIGAR